MNDEDIKIKAAEHRGYSRGYQAGRKRKKVDIDNERRLREERAFRDRAFLAVLPFAMRSEGWSMDGEPIQGSDRRVELAWRIANLAMHARRQQK